MKLNRIYLCTFIVLALSTAILAASVIELAKEKEENLDIIANLNAQVSKLETSVNHYESLFNKEKEQRAFRQFKENVFQLRFPKFSKVAKVVFQKSKEYGFNPYLIMAVIQVESGFNRFAVSTAGAYGLMQINFSVWKDELGIDYTRIFEPEYNVDLGLKILKHYYDKAGGNIFKALFRYNNGYKYKNTGYNGKIIATRFYSHRNKAEKTPLSNTGGS
jgi:soluble lytic murein transglycosylase-like protein